MEWLVERCKVEIERPIDTIRRVLEGARVEGNWDDMADVMLPYRCLIELYQRVTRLKFALAGKRQCA